MYVVVWAALIRLPEVMPVEDDVTDNPPPVVSELATIAKLAPVAPEPVWLLEVISTPGRDVDVLVTLSPPALELIVCPYPLVSELAVTVNAELPVAVVAKAFVPLVLKLLA